MSTHERPSQTPEPPSVEETHIKKLRMDTPEATNRRDEDIKQNIERLIAVEVDSRLDWSQMRRECIASHLREHEGPWRECDGDYVVFNGFYADYGTRMIEAVFDNPSSGQETSRMIPMPDWMQSPED